MSLLIIQPDNTTKEAHEWLVGVFVQILDAFPIDFDENTTDDLTYFVECLSYKDVDTIFEKAVEGLLK